MAHIHHPRSIPDAERRLDVATAESHKAQVAVTRATESLVKTSEAQKAELQRVTSGTQARIEKQGERLEARRRNGSIETALEALKVFGRPH